MQTVTAYKADDGSLHARRSDAARASLKHLSTTKNKDSRGDSLGGDAIAFIVENRGRIVDILNGIDAVECEPNLINAN